MIKKIIGILLCMLMLSSVWVSASNSSAANSGVITVNIPVGSYTIDKTVQGELISVSGFGRLLVPGEPNLPSKIFSIAIPPGAMVTDIHTMTTDVPILGSHQIPPCTLPQAIGQENPGVYEQRLQEYTTNYQTTYTSKDPYPTAITEIAGTGGYRKYNIVEVRVNPVTYCPALGNLVFHSAISVSIDYTIPKDSSSRVINDNLPRTEATAREIILNYDQAQPWYTASPTTDGLHDYVIITTDNLVSSVTSLVDWESAKNRNVYVATTSWIADNYQGYDLSAKMRAFLHEKYPSSEWGIMDVCLVGSYSDVPMRNTAQGCDTDYYYAELSLPDNQSWDANGNHQYGENSGDPIDFLAEVNVGRIPWSDPAVVQSICQKSAAYEQNMDDSYKKNILLLGAYFWDDTNNAVLMEAKVAHSWMADWTMTRMYEQAQSSYPSDYDLTYANVKTVWSAGTYAFVDWAGHGSPDAAYELYPEQPFIDETSVLSLNDAYPAIVFADSCSNSDTDYLNIGQALLKQGAVGFLGSNKVAYGCPGWSNPMSGSSQSLDYFFTTGCTSYNYTQGGAHQYALRQMYVYNLWGDLRYEAFEWGSLWGNPDLTMGPVTTSNPPGIPTLSGPTQGAINNQITYSSSASDPDGDQVYYRFNWGDGNVSDWLGPYASGTATSASYAWSNPGNYAIKARAKDSNGAVGAWSEPLVVNIILDSAPLTPVISGPAAGTIRKPSTYVVQTSDPEGDNLSYYIDWGDGKNTGWIGPYASGEQVTQTHTWTKQGSYTIRVGSCDCYGMKSSWGTLPVTMPYQPSWNLLQRLFDRFPHAFPLLRLLFEGR